MGDVVCPLIWLIHISTIYSLTSLEAATVAAASRGLGKRLGEGGNLMRKMITIEIGFILPSKSNPAPVSRVASAPEQVQEDVLQGLVVIVLICCVVQLIYVPWYISARCAAMIGLC